MLKISEDGKIQFTWKAMATVILFVVSASSSATWQWFDVRSSQHRAEEGQQRIEQKLGQVVTLQDLTLHDLQMQVLNPTANLKYPEAPQYFHGAQRMSESQQNK